MRLLPQNRRTIPSALPPIDPRPGQLATVARRLLAGRLLAAGLALGFLTTGCELSSSLENLATELGNPENTTAESPGTRLTPSDESSPIYATGYKDIRFDGNNADGAYVVTRTYDDELLVIPFSQRAKNLLGEDVEGCSLGPVQGFRNAYTRTDDVDAVFDAKLPFVSVKDDVLALRFADLSCQVVDVDVPGGGFPIGSFGPRDGFVVQEAQARLWFVDPWGAEKLLIAEDLSPIRNGDVGVFNKGPNGDKWLWTLESGEIVARDSSFKEVFRAGSGVARVLFANAGSPDMRFLYTDANNAAFTFTAEAPSDVEQIAEQVCDPRFNDGQDGTEALFLDCDSRNLTRYSFKEDTTTVLVKAVASYRVLGNVESGPMLLYILDANAGTNVGPLYAQWGTNKPFFLGENGHLDLSTISQNGTRKPIINWSATGGDLMYAEGEEDAHLVASNVALLSAGWLVSDFDGQNGKLQRITNDELTLVDKSAAIDGLIIDTALDRALYVGNLSDGRGQLMLADGEETRKMSKEVGPGAYQFTQQLKTVTAIAGSEGELRLHRVDSAAEITINKGVTEVLEVAWPERGFLYSAPNADEPGVYFAKLIP
jgi:hypothetical protein